LAFATHQSQNARNAETIPEEIPAVGAMASLLQNTTPSMQTDRANIATARNFRALSAQISCIDVAATNAGTTEIIDARSSLESGREEVQYEYSSSQNPVGTTPTITTMKKITKLG
jgi:hypothetical protein